MTEPSSRGAAPQTADGLLREYETMQNMALSAYALAAVAWGFQQAPHRRQPWLTLWHLFSALPLVLHETSRAVILKRRPKSGLRSILDRDPEMELRQNESVLYLPARMYEMRMRTVRAINCALAWDLLMIADGVFATGHRFEWPRQAKGEAGDILKAAQKLGGWAAQCSTFEYLNVLGIDPTKPPVAPGHSRIAGQ